MVNPVGRINGTQATNLYAVSAHIDSIADDASSQKLVPGADDDGSGLKSSIKTYDGDDIDSYNFWNIGSCSRTWRVGASYFAPYKHHN